MKSAFAIKLLRNIAWAAISVVGGWRLTYYIDDVLPGDMPYSVDMFIRFCLAVTGRDDLANPDDMEVLALLLYWAIAALFIGSLIFVCYVAVRHFRTGKVHRQ